MTCFRASQIICSGDYGYLWYITEHGSEKMMNFYNVFRNIIDDLFRINIIKATICSEQHVVFVPEIMIIFGTVHCSGTMMNFYDMFRNIIEYMFRNNMIQSTICTGASQSICSETI